MHDAQIVDGRCDLCRIYALSRLIHLADRRLLRHMQSQRAVTGERGALRPSGMAGMRWCGCRPGTALFCSRRQCLVTTGLSTLIATTSGRGGALQPACCLSTWAIAWLAQVPFVSAPAPFLDWLLSRVVKQAFSWTDL